MLFKSKIFGLLLITALVCFQPLVLAEDKIDPVIVDAQNAFAVKTFKALYSQKEKPNAFFAPLGSGTFLRFLLPFVKNSGQPVLTAALETGDLPPDQTANRSAGLWMISQNTEKEEIEIYSPMTVLGNKDVKFKSAFSGRAGFYKIFPRSYDLTHEGMKSSLEDWVRNGSNNRLRGITDYFDSSSPVAFLHGFYFKGRWNSKFESISSGDFETAAGGIEVPMLSASGHFEFYKDDHFEAVNIPYGTGLYGLYLFVPDSLPDFIENLKPEQLKEWANSFLERSGAVVFPKFSVQNSTDLRKVLRASGFESLFVPEADLFSVAEARSRIYLGSMEQKAVFEMDETPVKNPRQFLPEIDAAAQHDSINFKAGRPFFFMLRNNKTRAIAGLGVIEDPSAN